MVTRRGVSILRETRGGGYAVRPLLTLFEVNGIGSPVEARWPESLM